MFVEFSMLNNDVMDVVFFSVTIINFYIGIEKNFYEYPEIIDK